MEALLVAAISALIYGLLPPDTAPRETIVLLEDEDGDGRAGRLTVNPGGDSEVVLDEVLASANLTPDDQLTVGRTTAEAVARTFGSTLAAQPQPAVSFMLYFETGTLALIPESEAELQRMLAEVAARPAPEVTVIGHTDRVGRLEANDSLSINRAVMVRDLLIERGLSRDLLSVAGRGEREPLLQTADEVPEQRNRRVEISVR